MTSEQLIKHYKQCIANKQKLIDFYERRGNEGAVGVLENEIYHMKLKGKAVLQEMRKI